MIPIVIGSYPILDQPPNYFTTMNTIVPVPEISVNSNSNSNANGNLNSHSNTSIIVNANVLSTAISNILNNEQVVRPQSNALPFDDAKTTDAETSIPYPQHG